MVWFMMDIMDTIPMHKTESGLIYEHFYSSLYDEHAYKH